MTKSVQRLQERVTINKSRGSTEIPEKAFCGKPSRDTLPKMLTQSLLQSKDLITSNTHKASESPDSLALCVGKLEGKKQRIGVRLSIAERQALEQTAKENNMTLSNLICQVAQIFAHQKSA